MKLITSSGTFIIVDNTPIIMCGIECIEVKNETPDEFDPELLYIPLSKVLYFTY